MMAVGLNIVVGYAGLLDLGYVAFYAMGAYTAAWFASLQFPHRTLALRRGRHHAATCRASTSRSGSLLADRRARHRARRDPDRPADAAPARRLPRDRDARLRRDPAADRAQRRQPLRHRLQPHERAERDHAARLAGFGNHISNLTGGFLPANYLTCCTRTTLGHQITVDRRLLLDGDRAAAVHGLLLVAAAVLAARPRLDRDPRGRDRGRGDGRAADADEDVGVRDRRVLRRRRRRLLREFKSATFPGDFFFNISVFILCMVILGGMGNIWGVIVGARVPRLPQPGGAREHRAWLNANIHHRQPAAARQHQPTRRAALRVRHLRADHPARDALPAGRADPVAARRRGAARRRARRAALRRQHAGTES